ncbi:MAG: AmmeMemoRadiSam system radical SAM enzyme, partial [Planctomycetota bacterium]
MPGLDDVQASLDRHTTAGAPDLVREEKSALRCLACGHRCLIRDGRRGVCRVRSNDGGTLRVPRGYVGALQVDPVEKKPFFHVLPGSEAVSFGMLGCDFHCDYCQNWLTSQTLRDPASTARLREMEPQDIVDLARVRSAPIVVSTYNEPLITADWAHEIFTACKDAGLVTGFVSNGNATPEVLDYLRPVTDLYKVDLKAFREATYRQLGGQLRNVCATIEGLLERGFWVEIVTLLVPGLNDGEDELRELTAFLAGLSADLPWHVTGFHPDYRMTDREHTRADGLLRAADIGREAGLRFVYTGNRPGRTGDGEDTKCPGCFATLI